MYDSGHLHMYSTSFLSIYWNKKYHKMDGDTLHFLIDLLLSNNCLDLGH